MVIECLLYFRETLSNGNIMSATNASHIHNFKISSIHLEKEYTEGKGKVKKNKPSIYKISFPCVINIKNYYEILYILFFVQSSKPSVHLHP